MNGLKLDILQTWFDYKIEAKEDKLKGKSEDCMMFNQLVLLKACNISLFWPIMVYV